MECAIEGLRIGGSVTGNSWTVGSTIGNIDYNWDAFLLSLEYTIESLTIAVEYLQADNEASMAIGERSWTNEGYYGLLTYRLTNWLELGTYYSIYYDDKDDKDGDRFRETNRPEAMAWLKDFALSARFDINESWIFKLEGHYMDGLARNVEYDKVDPDENWLLFGAKMTFSF